MKYFSKNCEILCAIISKENMNKGQMWGDAMKQQSKALKFQMWPVI